MYSTSVNCCCFYLCLIMIKMCFNICTNIYGRSLQCLCVASIGCKAVTLHFSLWERLRTDARGRVMSYKRDETRQGVLLKETDQPYHITSLSCWLFLYNSLPQLFNSLLRWIKVSRKRIVFFKDVLFSQA